MKIIIIYESTHGNTQKVAQAMGDAIGARVALVSDINPAELKSFDLIIIGSPTHGGFPSEGIHNLLKIPLIFQDARVAVFDTRTKTTIFGYAAPKMAKNIQKNTAHLLAPPEGFFVLGTKGPLMEGEIERAVAWAKNLIGQYQEEML
jgi:flavodoxin